MADIRLSKIIRQYNIGLDILVDFLRRQGVEVEVNPNAKVSDELLPAIDKQFGKDLELKQAADKVDVKITEIIEKSNKRRSRDVEEEEDEPEHETIIKSNTFFNPKPEQETVQSRAEEPEAPAEQIPEPAEEAAVVEPEPAVEPAPAVPEPEKGAAAWIDTGRHCTHSSNAVSAETHFRKLFIHFSKYNYYNYDHFLSSLLLRKRKMNGHPYGREEKKSCRKRAHTFIYDTHWHHLLPAFSIAS